MVLAVKCSYNVRKRLNKQIINTAIPILYTLIGPGIGSAFIAYYLISNGIPNTEIGLIGLCLGISVLLGLGLLHGTTLALVLGYTQVFPVDFAIWLPCYVMANILGLLGARLFGSDQTFTLGVNNQRLNKSIELFEHQLSKNGAWAVFWFRLSPIVPFALGTLLLSRTKIKWSTMIFMGTLGALPRTFLVMQLGRTALTIKELLEGTQKPSWSLYSAIILLVLSGAGLWFWGKGNLSQKTNSPEELPQ